MTSSPTRRPPFGDLRPAMALAALYAVAAATWAGFGDALPGGRWLAVHLFTLGVVTNLVVALTHHFAATLLHAPSRGGSLWRLGVVNLGSLGVVVGLPAGNRLLLAAGGVLVSAGVMWLYVDLRRMRKRSLTQRFSFVVRAYERATAAFLHGALLGVLLGTGVLSSAWYLGARLAHLHVNVLGWAGLTLLGTVVFFGPTILRTRMRDGADRRGALAIRHGASGLTLGALALLATGFGGTLGVGMRLLAAVGLAVFAAAVTVVARDVVGVASDAKPSAHARMIVGACAWFAVAAWADVAVVATGRYHLLDAVGAVLLVGVLLQAMLASAGYLAPMVWAVDGRDQARASLEALGWARVAAVNLAVVALAAGAAPWRVPGAAGAALIALAAAGGVQVLVTGRLAWRRTPVPLP